MNYRGDNAMTKIFWQKMESWQLGGQMQKKNSGEFCRRGLILKKQIFILIRCQGWA
jgi:hypothetical protein